MLLKVSKKSKTLGGQVHLRDYLSIAPIFVKDPFPSMVGNITMNGWKRKWRD